MVDLEREVQTAYLLARDRWERTEQLPSVASFLLLSREELDAIVAGEGLLLDVLRRDIREAFEAWEAV